MSSDYSLIPGSDFYSRFEIKNSLPELISVTHIRPGAFMPVIFNDHGRHIDIMRWGFTPQWAKDLSFGAKNFHAPSEHILESAVFRGSFNSCRCLVPASGFYNFITTSEHKENYFITVKNESVFSFAGLYSIWESADGSYLPTFAIMTTPSSPRLKLFHDRMPVILSKDDESLWLNPITPSVRLFPLLRPAVDSLISIAKSDY